MKGGAVMKHINILSITIILMLASGCRAVKDKIDEMEAEWDALEESLMAAIPEKYRPTSDNTGTDPGKPRQEYFDFGRRLESGTLTFEIIGIVNADARNEVGPEAFICELTGERRGNLHSCDRNGAEGRVYFMSSEPEGDPKYYKIKECAAFDDNCPDWAIYEIKWGQGQDSLSIKINGNPAKHSPYDHYGSYKGLWMGGNGDVRRATKGRWRNMRVVDGDGNVVVEKE
jgi:hypothetical protein